MTAKEQTDLALKYADQVANALRGKFTEYNVYVRLIEAVEYNYLEIAVKHKKTNEEWTVAYSDSFFYEMVDAAEKQKRAQRILKDLKIHMGIHD